MSTIRAITPTEIKAYEEDGAVCLCQLFSPEWVSKLRNAAAESLNKPSKLHV